MTKVFHIAPHQTTLSLAHALCQELLDMLVHEHKNGKLVAQELFDQAGLCHSSVDVSSKYMQYHIGHSMSNHGYPSVLLD